MLVGMLGVIGCAGEYLRYRVVHERKTSRLAPEIEKAYERLAVQ